ncbi:hypothetical protein, partial [Stenotrophomonas maltophilia]|uniref:hypothetical protein n=1 Tax=Stenotrophomonas maltophilia TaxID=40324 RepID=UPI001B7D81C0
IAAVAVAVAVASAFASASAGRSPADTPSLSIPRSGLSAARTPATAGYAATELPVIHREPP